MFINVLQKKKTTIKDASGLKLFKTLWKINTDF